VCLKELGTLAFEHEIARAIKKTMIEAKSLCLVLIIVGVERDG